MAGYVGVLLLTALRMRRQRQQRPGNRDDVRPPRPEFSESSASSGLSTVTKRASTMRAPQLLRAPASPTQGADAAQQRSPTLPSAVPARYPRPARIRTTSGQGEPTP